MSKFSMCNGYNLFRADHPSNTKRLGVHILYKESPFVSVLYVAYLTKPLLREITIQNKKGYVFLVYDTPQPKEIMDFKTFYQVKNNASRYQSDASTAVSGHFTFHETLGFFQSLFRIHIERFMKNGRNK